MFRVVVTVIVVVLVMGMVVMLVGRMFLSLEIMGIRGQHPWCLAIYRALVIIVVSPATSSVIASNSRAIRPRVDRDRSAAGPPAEGSSRGSADNKIRSADNKTSSADTN